MHSGERGMTHTNHTPPCRVCQSAEHVSHIRMPEFRDVRYYRCANCYHAWATDLQGVETTMGREVAVSRRLPTRADELRTDRA